MGKRSISDLSETNLETRLRRLEQKVLGQPTPREITVENTNMATLVGTTESVDGKEINPSSLSGSIVGRSEPIDHISGDIYVTQKGATDPTTDDGDIWIQF